MDLELTEAQRSARDVARRFAREKLGPIGVEADRSHRYPSEAIDELARLGMLGIFLPEQYGGAGPHPPPLFPLVRGAAAGSASPAGIKFGRSLAPWWACFWLGSGPP